MSALAGRRDEQTIACQVYVLEDAIADYLEAKAGFAVVTAEVREPIWRNCLSSPSKL